MRIYPKLASIMRRSRPLARTFLTGCFGNVCQEGPDVLEEFGVGAPTLDASHNRWGWRLSLRPQ